MMEFSSEKKLKIVEGYGEWVRLEDGKWYNLSITDKGNVYFDGKFVCNNKKAVEYNHEPIDDRFEILDL